MIPRLESERLALRGWEIDDFSAYAEFCADEERMRYIGGARDAFRAWQAFASYAGEWLLNGYGIFAVVEKASMQVAGYAGLWHPPLLDEPELAWGLYAGFEGNGYAVEAARMARDWAATDLGLPPLTSFVHPENLPSQAVATRLEAMPLPPTTLRGEPRLQFRHRSPV
jgi:RimJ/RimL family protein N-acetyltransferase